MSAAMVLFVQHAPMIGGSVISLRNLVRDAVGRGYACCVVCLNREIACIYEELGATTVIGPVAGFTHNTSYWYRARPRDIARAALQAIRIIRGSWFVNRLAKKLQPDLIHLNSSTLIPYCLGLRGSGVPVLVHIRENVVGGYCGIRRWLLRRCCDRFAAHIFFISEREYEIFRTDSAKSSVVYNYVDFDHFAAPPPRESVERQKCWRLLSLGGIAEIKGTHTLVEAAIELGEQVELTIVGSEDPRLAHEPDSYEARIAHLLGTSHGNVRMVGPRTDIRPNLAACDILIFWGIVPHFARPVFEAWLFGKPVIIHCAVADGVNLSRETCYVALEDTAVALSRAIVEVTDDYPAYVRKAERGRAIARQKFGNQNFDRVQQVYDRLTGPLVSRTT